MQKKYSLPEVFEVAIMIEESGEAFYTKASQFIESHSDILKTLAAEEVGHKKIFQKLRDKFIKQSNQSQSEETLNYLHTIIDNQVFDFSKPITSFFQEGTTKYQIIELAISREKQSILIFLALNELLANSTDKEITQELIKEELKHIAILTELKKQ